MSKSNLKRAFTLIELLVVIAIIGVLTGIITANMSGAKGKARDVKRISDIGNVQLNLELYFDRCRKYPPADGTLPDFDYTDSSCTVSFEDYMTAMPTPPGSDAYKYYVNSDRNDYILLATLENLNSDALRDSISSSGVHYCDLDIGEYCVGPK